jgi:hypothetical protein
MNSQRTIKYLLIAGWLSFLTSAQAATNTTAHIYPCGEEIALKIGHDLVATLDAKFQSTFMPEAIAIQYSDTPVMMSLPRNRPGTLRQVTVSTGFIDLLNHMAHAKAIDRIKPGYLSQYVAGLARQGVNENPVAPANINDDHYWSDAVMQDQVSLFNQMISMTLALNLSHLYLDHYDKYAMQAMDGRTLAINNVITATDWQASVKCAALNSLDCALPGAGAEALFDCIDRLPRHPVWADYIVPQGVNIKKLNQQLAQYEHDYYCGDSTFLHPRQTWSYVARKDGSSSQLAAQRLAQVAN